jgi:hypothetical protein
MVTVGIHCRTVGMVLSDCRKLLSDYCRTTVGLSEYCRSSLSDCRTTAQAIVWLLCMCCRHCRIPLGPARSRSLTMALESVRSGMRPFPTALRVLCPTREVKFGAEEIVRDRVWRFDRIGIKSYR